MMKNRCLLVLTSIILVSTGCASLNSGEQTSTPEPTRTPTPALTVTVPQDVPTSGEHLTIWVPPQFDPNSESAVGTILKARLDEFLTRRPGVELEVRIKPPEGSAGLIESLSTTATVAFGALPDLILMDRTNMERAAGRGLLSNLDELSPDHEDPDWYDFAIQLAHIHDTWYGFPFAADALSLVYRPAIVIDPPRDWASILDTKTQISFPAADPSGLFPLALYLSQGGRLQDEQGSIFLEADILGKVLSQLREMQKAALIPYWSVQANSFDAIWKAYLEGKTQAAIVWASFYLSTLPEKTGTSILPSFEGVPYTVATGWSWVLPAHPSLELKQKIRLELAEFLSDSSFMAEWTAAAGYLPTRPSALGSWVNVHLQSFASQIVLSAHLLPPENLLARIGPVLSEATIQVLSDQSDPYTVAQTAADKIASGK